MTWSPDERDVRLVRPGVAVVVSTGGVQPTEAAELTPDRASVQTTVLVESTGTWRVAAFHNTANSRQPAPDHVRRSRAPAPGPLNGNPRRR
ncbi:MAG TPA: SgcJ/EcaC family oxidoreductase [Pseudonocardia sp.]|nr:SgcJ/EcaC family oxidoreductase [Pseudonocardia sp.]